MDAAAYGGITSAVDSAAYAGITSAVDTAAARCLLPDADSIVRSYEELSIERKAR
ncbi:hypothetical protein D3C86_2058710 [compost metagenome]